MRFPVILPSPTTCSFGSSGRADADVAVSVLINEQNVATAHLPHDEGAWQIRVVGRIEDQAVHGAAEYVSFVPSGPLCSIIRRPPARLTTGVVP